MRCVVYCLSLGGFRSVVYCLSLGGFRSVVYCLSLGGFRCVLWFIVCFWEGLDVLCGLLFAFRRV